MKVSSNSKITLLATVIISFVVCAIVCVGIAFGSPPENRMLQELSSFVMEMLLFFVIWVQITSSTNTVLRQADCIYNFNPNLHRFQKPFVWAYWSVSISATGTVVLKHLPVGNIYLIGTVLSLISLLIYIILFVTYKFNYIHIALTKGTEELKKKILKSIVTNVVVYLITGIGILLWAIIKF